MYMYACTHFLPPRQSCNRAEAAQKAADARARLAQEQATEAREREQEAVHAHAESVRHLTEERENSSKAIKEAVRLERMAAEDAMRSLQVEKNHIDEVLHSRTEELARLAVSMQDRQQQFDQEIESLRSAQQTVRTCFET
jgi:hypothetical protein